MNAIDGGEGQRRYGEAGSPTIPSLFVDGRVFPVLHPVQLASMLDLPRPKGGPDALRLAWDTVSILESWATLLPQASWEQALKPTPSRGRSIRNLTVNTFRPFELLREAWHTRRFDWYTGEEDVRHELQLTSLQELEEYARRTLKNWEVFLTNASDDLAEEPIIYSNRGDVPFSIILESQRWHAAFHHRQLVNFLRTEGIQPHRALDVEGFQDLDLPEEVY